MRKSNGLLIISLVLFASALAYGTGVISSLTGSWDMTNATVAGKTRATYSSPVYGTNSNNTIRFSVAGVESSEGPTGLIYGITTTGSFQLTFAGGQPTTVTCSFCAKSYSNGEEIITYGTGRSDTLTLIWACPPFCTSIATPANTEAKRVLFLDDFLIGTIADQGWTLDLYQSPSIQPGIYTTSGYLAIRAKPSSNIEALHVTTPEYVSSNYQNNTVVKRKLTAALYPYQQKENPATSTIEIGFTHLLSSGAYPGYTPAFTPAGQNTAGVCSQSSTPPDNIGPAFVTIDNEGVVQFIVCGSPSGTEGVQSPGIINPLLYTAVTVETYGVFCSNCNNDLLPTTGWVYFRIYQEDSSHNIIPGTDKNYNFTASTFPQVSPLTGTLYTFISQSNSNSAATSQTSYIDLIQVQNYGSPVCLFGCLPPIIDITTLQPLSSVWAALVTLANLLGNGDLAWGSFLLYAGLCLGIIVPSVAISKSFILAAMEFLGITGLMLTAGLLGTVWIFAIALGMGYIGYAIIKKMFLSSGNAIMSGGGSEE